MAHRVSGDDDLRERLYERRLRSFMSQRGLQRSEAQRRVVHLESALFQGPGRDRGGSVRGRLEPAPHHQGCRPAGQPAVPAKPGCSDGIESDQACNGPPLVAGEAEGQQEKERPPAWLRDATAAIDNSLPSPAPEVVAALEERLAEAERQASQARSRMAQQRQLLERQRAAHADQVDALATAAEAREVEHRRELRRAEAALEEQQQQERQVVAVLRSQIEAAHEWHARLAEAQTEEAARLAAASETEGEELRVELLREELATIERERSTSEAAAREGKRHHEAAEDEAEARVARAEAEAEAARERTARAEAKAEAAAARTARAEAEAAEAKGRTVQAEAKAAEAEARAVLAEAAAEAARERAARAARAEAAAEAMAEAAVARVTQAAAAEAAASREALAVPALRQAAAVATRRLESDNISLSNNAVNQLASMAKEAVNQLALMAKEAGAVATSLGSELASVAKVAIDANREIGANRETYKDLEQILDLEVTFEAEQSGRQALAEEHAFAVHRQLREARSGWALAKMQLVLGATACARKQSALARWARRACGLKVATLRRRAAAAAADAADLRGCIRQATQLFEE